MKIKYIDESISKKIVYDRFTYKKIDDEFFKGYVGLVDIGNISVENHYVPRENREDDCIVSSNYKYLRIFIENKNYAILAIYNDKLEFIEFYIDIVDRLLIDKNSHLPYIEDLYLDIVYTFKNEIVILDEDELENALEKHIIDDEKYNLAINTKNEVMKYLNDIEYMEKIKKYCNEHLKEMLLNL